MASGVQTGSRMLGRRWYSEKIPYRLDPNVPAEMEANIKAVLKEIEDKAGFDFWNTNCNPGPNVRNNHILFK